jgi:hypothetical protein
MLAMRMDLSAGRCGVRPATPGGLPTVDVEMSHSSLLMAVPRDANCTARQQDKARYIQQ